MKCGSSIECVPPVRDNACFRSVSYVGLDDGPKFGGSGSVAAEAIEFFATRLLGPGVVGFNVVLGIWITSKGFNVEDLEAKSLLLPLDNADRVADALV